MTTPSSSAARVLRFLARQPFLVAAIVFFALAIVSALGGMPQWSSAVANRRTCVWCRHGVPAHNHRFYGVWTLCPEHKRLRNRLLREAARADA